MISKIEYKWVYMIFEIYIWDIRGIWSNSFWINDFREGWKNYMWIKMIEEVICSCGKKNERNWLWIGIENKKGKFV